MCIYLKKTISYEAEAGGTYFSPVAPGFLRKDLCDWRSGVEKEREMTRISKCHVSCCLLLDFKGELPMNLWTFPTSPTGPVESPKPQTLSPHLISAVDSLCPLPGAPLQSSAYKRNHKHDIVPFSGIKKVSNSQLVEL